MTFDSAHEELSNDMSYVSIQDIKKKKRTVKFIYLASKKGAPTDQNAETDGITASRKEDGVLGQGRSIEKVQRDAKKVSHRLSERGVDRPRSPQARTQAPLQCPSKSDARVIPR